MQEVIRSGPQGSSAVPPMLGVAAPAPPQRPDAVTPHHTQYPSGPVPGMPAGFPHAAGTTYPGAFFGIPGVCMTPVPGVTPPATTGGPHPLPGLPQFPLPGGFPNPFAVQQINLGPSPGPLPSPQAGTTTVAGPHGYMPGIGHAGLPAQAPGFPHFQGAGFPHFQGAGFPHFQGAGFPHFQGAGFPQPGAPTAGAMPAPVFPQGQPAAAPLGTSPFWLQLAWQLVQAPSVRTALGDRFQPLVEGNERLRTLQIAAACLVGPELQAAFRALTGGVIDQARFIESFARSFRFALQSAGLLAA